jgi:NTP pyrophosphatase (non-canonical NTP hydrolase)
MDLADLQRIIVATYGERDRARGRDATFRWLAEEVGELARAVRTGDPRALREEFSDVLAWTVSLAALCGIDAADAAARYARGCPKCGSVPCRCPGEPRR